MVESASRSNTKKKSIAAISKIKINTIHMKQHDLETPPSYIPLYVLIAVAALMSIALSGFPFFGSGEKLMRLYLGIFLCLFSMLKLFDIKGFQSSFALYDWIARRFFIYGFYYPIIELGLGLLLLSNFLTSIVCGIIIILAAVNVMGVSQAILQKMPLKCACMGSILNVPLSHVTLLEDAMMIIMALGIMSQV